ncbi:hypothetical protein R1sor_011185 [Riccia sorocarpa]|uniref:Uncharacterized protein n=1 Tax=Riccia sorocarpa TaxID=122646 RepID=A0ABD3I3M5_9MARC
MPIASIEGGDLCKVWDIKTLGLERDAEARKLLEEVAKQVQPIMRKRKWKVPLLSEFCPKNPSLLGLNIDGGREIRIRLRRSRYDSRLFSYESTLGTMLHELTHIQCGPHNAAFYKLLDELTKECEELMVKGITGTGQGFDTRGKRLGGVTHNPPPSNLRQIALAAAEKRSRLNTVMPGGPRRLGGDSEIMKALTPIQAAAMAAERRLKDDFWCAAPLTQGEDGMMKAKESEESASQPPVGLDQSQDASTSERPFTDDESSWRVLGNSAGPPLGVWPPSRLNAGEEMDRDGGNEGSRPISGTARKNDGKNLEVRKNPRAADSSGTSSVARRRLEGSERNSVSGEAHSRDEGTERNPVQLDGSRFGNGAEESSSWECQVCTLHNPALTLSCGACGTVRKVFDISGLRTWSCKFCTLENEEILSKCAACDQWRYSFGAPVAARAPNYRCMSRTEIFSPGVGFWERVDSTLA